MSEEHFVGAYELYQVYDPGSAVRNPRLPVMLNVGAGRVLRQDSAGHALNFIAERYEELLKGYNRLASLYHSLQYCYETDVEFYKSRLENAGLL